MIKGGLDYCCHIVFNRGIEGVAICISYRNIRSAVGVSRVGNILHDRVLLWYLFCLRTCGFLEEEVFCTHVLGLGKERILEQLGLN